MTPVVTVSRGACAGFRCHCEQFQPGRASGEWSLCARCAHTRETHSREVTA